MVKFDGKHWIAKKTRAGPLRIYSYNHVARQSNGKLGPGGIVAVPNARPDEYRFEEFHNSADRIKDITDGRVFYDINWDIYFIKAQEINTKLSDIPITFLAYNLPFRKNLDDKDGYEVLENVKELDGILGITGPKCIKNLEKVLDKYPDLLGHLDFFVSYSSSATLYGTNKESMDFYDKNIADKEFEHPSKKDRHKIGVISVSGGHRTPYSPLDYIRNGFTTTIGRSYTEINKPNDDTFMKNLRESLRNSTKRNLYMKPTVIEKIRHIISIKIVDKFRK